MHSARPLRGPSAKTGAAIVVGLVLFAALGPVLLPHGPLHSDFVRGTSGDGMPVAPQLAFPLGTDRLFRDVLSRLASAARLSLFIAVSAATLSTVIGAVVGMAAGWLAGTRVDALLMRIVDVLLAVPFLLLVMTVSAAMDRTSTGTVLLTLGLTGWLGIARVIRAKTMQIRAQSYVEAARAIGQSTPSIARRHLLPNLTGLLIAVATLQVAQMILADSILGYLGAGVSPPTPSWGRMLLEGEDYVTAAPWILLAPGCAILLSVWAFNALGEGLRDSLEPRQT